MWTIIKYLIYVIFCTFLFSSLVNSTEIKEKNYLSKNCKGHKSICDDSFTFNITLKKKIIK